MTFHSALFISPAPWNVGIVVASSGKADQGNILKMAQKQARRSLGARMPLWSTTQTWTPRLVYTVTCEGKKNTNTYLSHHELKFLLHATEPVFELRQIQICMWR